MVDAKKIRELRDGLGLTMQEAADRAGLTDRQRWNDVESGRRRNISADTLQAVARALGVSMDSLMATPPRASSSSKARRKSRA